MHLLTFLSFAFFTGMVALGTWLIIRRQKRVDSNDYFLAGRGLGAIYIAGSLLLTNLSTEQLVGLNGDAFTNGLSVMAWEVVSVISLVAMALFFLPKFLRSGISTVPQFLELRFDHTTQVICNLIFLVAYTAILLPIVLYTGATGLNEIIDMQGLTGIHSETGTLWLTVWVVGIIGALYAIFWGMRGVAVSDTLNGVLLLSGGFMIVWFGLAAAGKGDGVFAGLNAITQAHPEKFNSIGGPTQAVPFGTLFTGVLLLCTFYWCTNQQIIQRTFAAKNLAEGQKGVLLTGALKLLGPLYLVLPGIIAFHLFADRGLKPDHAYGTLVREVLPPWLTGFFLAAMVGAVFSSFCSALNSTVTLFCIGIYKGMWRKEATEPQVVAAGKIFGWVVAIISMTVAPLLAGQGSIFSYLQKMNGMYFIPIFSVVLIGLLARRMPPLAAKVGLVGGFLMISAGYFIPAIEKWLADIPLHGFHFLGVVFALLVVTMLIITALAPSKQAWVHVHTGEVDLTPWPWTKRVAVVLLVIVAAIYLRFADMSVLQPKPVASLIVGPPVVGPPAAAPQ